MYVVRSSEKAQAIKMCQQFLWLFLRVWLQPKRDREKKKRKLILTGTSTSTYKQQ